MSQAKSDPRQDMLPCRLAGMEALAGAEQLALFTVEPASGEPIPPFQAGQYTTVAFEQGSDVAMRYYSIASGPEQAQSWQFFIRKPDKPGATGELFDMEPGSPLWVGQAGGAFTLERSSLPHRVFVANGTGLAPFLSMSRHLRAQAEQGSVASGKLTLLHGVCRPQDLACRSELEAIADNSKLDFLYLPCISRPQEEDVDSSFSHGRVEEVLMHLLNLPGCGDSRPVKLAANHSLDTLRQRMPAGETALFLCGATDMVKAVVAQVESSPWGDGLVYEKYW
ncbi:MAG: hypothetical protein DWQ01_20625 [Planctomycetota bacterium]|nr:MAG: hypothetical protein DWQ01_20625 [Planctomycetota bacterium]